MTRGLPASKWTLAPFALGVLMTLPAPADQAPQLRATFLLALDRGHPWRPPFGLDRVASPPAVVVRSSGRPAGAGYILAVRRGGRESGRPAVRFPENPPHLPGGPGPG